MMEGKERKRADDLPAGAVEQVRELLNRPRSSADFSPAARYAVSKLCDYAEQEHEQREKAETRFCGERRKALAFSAEMARQERTIDDLRQQLSFLRQAMQDAGGVRMDAVEFFSEFRRMCKSSSDCTKCEHYGDRCDNAIELLGKTVAAVEQWSREHPRKTRQDVFLEQYPEAELTKDGAISICPNAVSAAEIEFKPCPFCGGEIDGPTSVQCNYGKKIITLGLACAKCKTSFKFRAAFTDEPFTEARHAWNRRAEK